MLPCPARDRKLHYCLCLFSLKMDYQESIGIKVPKPISKGLLSTSFKIKLCAKTTEMPVPEDAPLFSIDAKANPALIKMDYYESDSESDEKVDSKSIVESLIQDVIETVMSAEPIAQEISKEDITNVSISDNAESSSYTSSSTESDVEFSEYVLIKLDLILYSSDLSEGEIATPRNELPIDEEDDTSAEILKTKNELDVRL